MERNPRDFEKPIQLINSNAEAACDFLRSRSIAGGYSGNTTTNTNAATQIKEVRYPKYITQEHYNHCRINPSPPRTVKRSIQWPLFLDLHYKAASQVFFDTLPCYKGPSLATNFTLVYPFTILAHFTELESAVGPYGVEEGLVRVGVGMEERGELLKGLGSALEAAEAAAGVAGSG
ncbi:hypothetical protein EST38_g11690 [Candolleomyces aberdarensis]|uniref:Uncharacterized protein n=1 Tax=Candolleomyces aberdarensis TaxID=2316362 RepID=A0A4Q2D6J8_9AGAR|nr:hypothetical protein EST38_g11690 [Candolleomyces aberdarensis]